MTAELSGQSDKEFPLLGVGAGLTYFRGDVGSSARTGGAFRTEYRVGIEHRFLGTLGAELYRVCRTQAANECNKVFYRNFTTKFMSIGGGLMFNLDNDYILSRRSSVCPYWGIGCMRMTFLMVNAIGPQKKLPDCWTTFLNNNYKMGI